MSLLVFTYLYISLHTFLHTFLYNCFLSFTGMFKHLFTYVWQREDIWLTYGWHLADIWLTCGTHLACMWLIYAKLIGVPNWRSLKIKIILWICGRHVLHSVNFVNMTVMDTGFIFSILKHGHYNISNTVLSFWLFEIHW